MKTKLPLRAQWLAGLSVAILVAGYVPDAHTDQPIPITTVPAAVGVPDAPVFGAADPAADPAVASANASAPATVIKKFDPGTIQLSAGVQDVVRLAQAGVSENVIKAFVEKSNIPYNPTAEEIIFLTDIGIPNTLITAMLQQGNKVREQNPNAPAPRPAPPAPAPTYSEPAAQSVPPPPSGPPQSLSAPDAPPPTAEVTQFYSALAPYGSWMYTSDLGWCWQPSVAVYQSSWRPYGDRGRWLYSDVGWYWQSDYSWGWAPFHYGRWTQHNRHGWLWTPDSLWAPAWVSWRYTDGYCGWAPLPHYASYRHGDGFYYGGSRVSVGFEFGLSFGHFTFIAADRFCDPNPHSFYLPATRVQTVYKQTTVINNYTINNSNVVINQGIPANHIPAVARQEVRKVSVQEWNPSTHASVAPDRVQQAGATPVIYRPQSPQVMQKAAENPASRVHTELAKRAITTTQQRLATPAASITTTPQRPLVTPAARPFVEPQAVTKPVTPTVTGNVPRSAPTGAASNVRPFDQPATTTQPHSTVTPRAVPAPGRTTVEPVTPRAETPKATVFTPPAGSQRLPIYTPQPSTVPAGRPAVSANPPQPVHTPEAARPQPQPRTTFTPPAQETPAYNRPYVGAAPSVPTAPPQRQYLDPLPSVGKGRSVVQPDFSNSRGSLQEPSRVVPVGPRPSVVSPGTERSGSPADKDKDKDSGNPLRRK